MDDKPVEPLLSRSYTTKKWERTTALHCLRHLNSSVISPCLQCGIWTEVFFMSPRLFSELLWLIRLWPVYTLLTGKPGQTKLSTLLYFALGTVS